VSLSDPLALASFADLLHLDDVKFYPQWSQQVSGSGGGIALYADRAPMLWAADCTTTDLDHADAEAIMALLNSRAGGLKKALLYNPKLKYPSSDPTGSVFGSATPTVNVVTDALHVSFSGFPNGYSIPLGTYFQIIFNSTQYYLGQFCEAVTASGAGAISTVEVAPALPASIANGNAVTVKKPAATFNVVPNSVAPAMSSMMTTKLSFQARQTY
jgi:hypothetical protein